MVTVLYAVGLARIVLDQNCAVGCGSETDCVGWYSAVGCGYGTDCVGCSLCCRVWDWNGLCCMVTVLLSVGIERILLDGNCAIGFETGRDFFEW